MKEKHTITIDADCWKFASASGNASQLIEDAVRDLELKELQRQATALAAVSESSGEAQEWRENIMRQWGEQ